MKAFKKRHSLIRDFALFTSIVILIVLIYSTIRINGIQSLLIETRLSTQSQAIERYFLDRINYTSSILGYMGRQISQETGAHNNPDLYYIDKLFQAFMKDPKIKSVLSSTIVGWVDTDYRAVVDGVLRVMVDPIDLSTRDYIPKTIDDPWVIKLGQPVIGSTSGKPIIPAGVGVVNDAGKWLGTIIIGFQQSYLQDNFIKFLDFEGTNVALIDSAGQIIIETPTHFISNNIPLADKIRAIDFSKHEKSEVQSNIPFLGFGVSYYYYKIPEYDYILFLAIDNPLTFELFKTIIFNHLLELFSVLFLSIVGIAFLNWRIIRPILILANETDVIARKNSSDKKRIKLPDMSSELFQLWRGVLKLEILKKRNDKLYAKLKIAHKEAVDANAAKTEFLSSTAHELRSPMNAVIGFASMIKMQVFGGNMEKYIEYAGDIEQSGQELLEFVDDLLDLNKSEMGSFAIEDEEWVDIENIINRSIKLNINRAKKSGIKIIKQLEDNLPKAYVDSRRIRQILVNLLSNSVKYSPNNTQITISVSIREKRMVISVIDQGFGMNEAQVKIALKKWGTVKNAKSDEVDSHGLGLPLAKYLAELHGAEFIIDSVPDKGTRVSVIFPEVRVAELTS
jgi:signal transduction histidine kinase